MTTVNGTLGISSTSNSSQFQAFDKSLFTASGVNQVSLQNTPLQLQNSQMLMQRQVLQTNTLEREITSVNTSPVPNQHSPDNISHSVTRSTPEKSATSQSPPSPADSGVVVDSRSEVGNILQDLIPNLDQCKLDDGQGFMSCPKTPSCGANFGTSTPIPEDQSNNSVSGFHNETILNPSINSFGLSTCNSNLVPNSGLDNTLSQLPENNSVTISQSLAAIWSSPTPPVPTQDPVATPDIDEIIFQALQQQQLNGWPGPLSSKHDGIPSNPPPGLHNPSSLQRQPQQQQNTATHLQSLHQQQVHHRRSQSVVVTRPNLTNRSLSQQPGCIGGLSNMSQVKVDGLLLNSRRPSWGNGQASLCSAWPSGNGKSASLFNSLQLSSGSNRSTPFRKQSLTSQMNHPPLLNRSISTPAKHPSYMTSQPFPPLLDDNPFFQISEPSASNGFASFENKDSMGFSSLESQLYDIIKSSDHPSFAGHNLPRSNGKWSDIGNDGFFEKSPANHLSSNMNNGAAPFFGEYAGEKYSRKVFVGGLPPDIAEDEIRASFRQFGPLVVDWPHKAESKSYFPPKGYAFLLFQEELSVQALISCCLRDGDKLYLKVSSPTIREKPVQIRPWFLSDSDFVLDGSQPLDPRKTIFVGGVPRPLRAVELAMMMDRLYGGVCYAGIDVDPELKYPKGAGRVAFSNQQSYIAAISARFVQLHHGDIDKRVEVKPYVLDDQHCDECRGSRCGGKFAPFFCANVTCLQYYCENCWAVIHATPGRELHKPLVKEGADRTSRSMLYRW